MSPTTKKVLLVGCAFLLVFAIAFAVTGAYVYRAGMIVVDVSEGGPDGNDIHIRIPAALVQAGLGVVPDEVLAEMAADMGEDFEVVGPLVRAVHDELSNSPDFVIIDVRDHDEHVRIAKRGEKIVVDVSDGCDRVRVVLPLRMVDMVLGRIEKGARAA